MKLYLLTQNTNLDYDTYDSLIVCAENKEEAKKIRPDKEKRGECKTYGCWVCKIEDVQCREIWIASKWIEKWVILASFNAG